MYARDKFPIDETNKKNCRSTFETLLLNCMPYIVYGNTKNNFGSRKLVQFTVKKSKCQFQIKYTLN